MNPDKSKPAKPFGTTLDKAKNYGEVWKIVKETAKAGCVSCRGRGLSGYC